MKVLGSSIIPIQPVPVQSPNDQQAADIDGREQRNRAVGDIRDRANDSTQQAFEQQRSSDNRPARPVTSSREITESFGRRVDSSSPDDPLPLSTRRALQAFAENSPSPEQQLGIELVGIDVIV